MSYEAVVIGEPDLAYYWPMNEASGVVAHDAKASNDAASYQGTVTWNQPGIPGSNYSAAAVSAGGFSTSVGLAAPSIFSQEAWVRFNSSTTMGAVAFGSGPTGHSASYDRQFIVAPQFDWYLFGGGTTGAASLNDGKWHYLAGTVQQGGSWAQYVDGARIGGGVTGAMQFYGGFWRLADSESGTGSQQPFTGTLAHIAVYSQILSAERIAAHWAASTGSAVSSVRDPARSRIPGIN